MKAGGIRNSFMNSMKHAVSIHPIALAIGMCLLCIYYEADGQAQTGKLQDKDGNSYTIKTMPDNKKWMTDNLNINIPGSYCYENSEQKCKQYGRLYTWQSAQEGCKMLGTAWRLPTDEEWQRLAGYYGGVFGDSKDSGRTAYKALLYGGSAEFNVLLGGGRAHNDSSYARLEAHGFYWTATKSDTAMAWFYNFGKGRKMLYRQKDGEQQRAFSVRCIRDTGNLKEQR